jgi:hypothetical protein
MGSRADEELRIKRKLEKSKKRVPGVKVHFTKTGKGIDESGRKFTNMRFHLIPKRNPKSYLYGDLTYFGRKDNPPRIDVWSALTYPAYNPDTESYSSSIRPREVRRGMEKLFKMFPKTELLRGYRISGMRGRGANKYQIIKNPFLKKVKNFEKG